MRSSIVFAFSSACFCFASAAVVVFESSTLFSGTIAAVFDSAGVTIPFLVSLSSSICFLFSSNAFLRSSTAFLRSSIVFAFSSSCFCFASAAAVFAVSLSVLVVVSDVFESAGVTPLFLASLSIISCFFLSSISFFFSSCNNFLSSRALSLAAFFSSKAFFLSARAGFSSIASSFSSFASSAASSFLVSCSLFSTLFNTRKTWSLISNLFAAKSIVKSEVLSNMKSYFLASAISCTAVNT